MPSSLSFIFKFSTTLLKWLELCKFTRWLSWEHIGIVWYQFRDFFSKLTLPATLRINNKSFFPKITLFYESFKQRRCEMLIYLHFPPHLWALNVTVFGNLLMAWGISLHMNPYFWQEKIRTVTEHYNMQQISSALVKGLEIFFHIMLFRSKKF